MPNHEHSYQIALSLVPGIGDVLARNLISYLGSAENVFKTSKGKLQKIHGIGPAVADAIGRSDVIARAEQEINFAEKNDIKIISYEDDDYPYRLKQCHDRPLILFYKGTADLNSTRILNVIGTRKATEYGKDICRELIRGLSSLDVVIVSGLAYGIDVCAQREALKCGLNTIAVLGHGLDRIYPHVHRATALDIVTQGGLLSEFISGTIPDKENFPKRNRIVAGMTDATVLVESTTKGGAVLTARIAASYSRDVLAFPGRVGDMYSEGCNQLVKQNIAGLIEGADDLLSALSWDLPRENSNKRQAELDFDAMNSEEKKLYELIAGNSPCHVDHLGSLSGMDQSMLAAILLELEFNGMIRSLPGKMYERSQ